MSAEKLEGAKPPIVFARSLPLFFAQRLPLLFLFCALDAVSEDEQCSSCSSLWGFGATPHGVPIQVCERGSHLSCRSCHEANLLSREPVTRRREIDSAHAMIVP